MPSPQHRTTCEHLTIASADGSSRPFGSRQIAFPGNQVLALRSLGAKGGAGLRSNLIDAGLTYCADLVIGERAVLGLEAEAIGERA